MARNWSFGQKIGAGFAATVLLVVAIGWISIDSLRNVVRAKDLVIEKNARVLIEAQRLEAIAEQRAAVSRGYFLTRDQGYLDELVRVRANFSSVLRGVKETAPEARDEVHAVERAGAEYTRVSDGLIDLARSGAAAEAVEARFVSDVYPKRGVLSGAVDALINREETALREGVQAASESANSAIKLVIAIAITAALFGVLVAFFLTRALSRQIGAAVGQIQSSSSELQAAANQQATGSREQSSAMSEIATTINELLATSRQIADSAQKVAEMAEQTAGSATSGESIVGRAHESIAGIQRQVEQIVGHMLDLGKKSQQIGVVLDIVSELAEQTNILAINATIEANGAGEAGKRFGVVADEIRKLADRVGASTKEIRGLIEEVRSAVNTTVMATETGSKTVDAGTRQFSEVTTSLQQIAGLVGTTTEAAREIELSTKQQATAVEQVNVAIANVAQATKETEASSTQTLQTASQLAQLSKELRRVVQPEAST